MNLGSKCCQVLKLVGSVSSRNYRICTASRTFSKTRLRLIDGRKFDKRLSPFLETESRYFWTTSSSRSAQKNSDKKVEEKTATTTDDNEFANLGLIARFKKMYKEYWYVLLPVHIATSAVWLGSFYYASKSGMDIVAIMQNWNFNETLIKPFRDSSMGHVAVAYLLYKIATPARYTITLGATTVAIKHLVRMGYIKPVPSRAQMYQIYQDKKEIVQTRVADKKAELLEKKETMKGELETFKEDFRDSMKTVGTISNPQPPPIPEEPATETATKTEKSAKTEKDPKSDAQKTKKSKVTPGGVKKSAKL